MARPLARCATVLGTLLLVLLTLGSAAYAGAKPPDPIPEELAGARVGINKKTGEYCDVDTDKTGNTCRAARDCELPGTVCVGEGSTDPEEARRYEENQLARWLEKADHNQPDYEKIKKFLTDCVKKDKKPFQECQNEGAYKYPPPAKTPLTWIAGKISEAAAKALEEAAGALGNSVIWLLKKFAGIFNSVSTIQLSKTGIGPVMGFMIGISALVATFLLLLQFGKLAVSQKGAPLVTAITGLAKWGVILGVYVTATQVALEWSDTFSTALINYTLNGGSGTSDDASKAMKEQLGTMFTGLVSGSGGATAATALVTGSGIAPASVGFVIVISILCILAVGMLWVEMLIRQAGIMILVTVMPLALAGQMSDATSEWWPKARNALITLILMKPVIVICFSIGFTAMGHAEGVRNVLVGLIIFLLSCFAWPAIAKFMTFTTASAGNSAASGMLSSIGSSVSSAFGGYNPSLGGAGTVGGGSGYTRALEADNANSSGGGDGGGGGGGGRGFWSKAMLGRKSGSFGSKVGGTVGMGMQLAALGKDMLESTAQNTAAHAGLDHAAQGGRHVVVPRRGAEEAAPGSGGSSGSSGSGGPQQPDSAPPAQPASVPETEPPPAPPSTPPQPAPPPPPPAAPPEGS